ncbi:MAG: hypothetical protein KF805_12520 [Phycisphaeraceae bacterium]|nr:hypothetical protein [Phycisphaeraceae bacterium]
MRSNATFANGWMGFASRSFTRWGWVAGLVLLGAVAWFCAGCHSGTKDISRAASNTETLADRISDHSRALEPAVAGNKDAEGHLNGIKQAAADIKVETRKVHEAVTRVKDITPWWAQLLEGGVWIIIGAGALFALFYFGLAAPIRAFFVFVGSHFAAILPAKAKGQAKLDAEALESNPTPELDRSIAVRRASDPMYDAAWKAQRRAEQKAASKPVAVKIP